MLGGVTSIPSPILLLPIPLSPRGKLLKLISYTSSYTMQINMKKYFYIPLSYTKDSLYVVLYLSFFSVRHTVWS